MAIKQRCELCSTPIGHTAKDQLKVADGEGRLFIVCKKCFDKAD